MRDHGNPSGGKGRCERGRMILHSLKLFFRSFRTNLVINILNLLGLAAGLAACMLILIYLKNEFSYDSLQTNGDRIVRINTYLKVGDGQEINIPTASYPVAEGLAREISGVEGYVRFRFGGSSRPVYVGDRVFFENHLAWADSTLFDVFSYRLIKGNPATALADAQTVVLSRTTAEKYFGYEDPIGKMIYLRKDRGYAVTGVMEDIPQPSHMPSYPMILSLASLEIGGPDYWVGRSMYGSYLLLKEGNTAGDIQPLVDRVFDEHASELMELLHAESRVTLQPLSEIHFDNSLDMAFDYMPTVSYQKMMVFSLLAAVVIIVACLSFINLATARSGERARQVGVIKAVGGSRVQLAAQFMGEFIITAFMALAVAFVLVQSFLPVFGDFVGSELRFDYRAEPLLLGGFFLLALLVGLLAGIYPVMYITAFKPSDTIRKNFFTGSGRSRLRPFLIIFQFVASIALVLCTLTVVHQLDYMDGRDPGFDREQLLLIDTSPDMTLDDCRLLRNEALSHPSIIAGALSSHLPTMGHMENTYEVPEPVNCQMLMTRQFVVDEHFLETMGMELVEGRNFDEADPAAAGGNVIINETAARVLGYEDPVGRFLDANPAKGADNYNPVTIIGVVKDVNFQSFHHEILPILLIRSERTPGLIALRLDPSDVGGAIRHVRSIWEENFPGSPFNYRFFDENFARMYAAEIRLGKLFTFFSVLAIIISCMGLLALIAYSAERRTKEIGIRKVLGASVGNLFCLLSSEYLRLVLLATLVAWPVAGYAMRRWSDNFAYKAPFAWYLYPAAGVLAITLAVVIAGSYTIRVCRINPAETLRQE